MYIDTQKQSDELRGFVTGDDRNVKSLRQVAADAIAKRRTSQMADGLEVVKKTVPVPGPLICMYYAEQPGAKILPGGVVELPN